VSESTICPGEVDLLITDLRHEVPGDDRDSHSSTAVAGAAEKVRGRGWHAGGARVIAQ
jgi:hypothetical protein